MIPSHYKGFFTVTLLCAAQVWLAPTSALAATSQLDRASGHRPVAGPPPMPEPPPPMPLSRSPIVFFRELLAMSPAERRQALTNRPPESQQRILAKVHEYQSLKPDDRELRLQITELQWYLLPLMSGSATNRAAQLAEIPLRQRARVEARLREWDKLPPSVQKGLLENQAVLRYMAEIQGLTDQRRREIVNSLSPTRRELLQQGIARWHSMSVEQRRNTLEHFNRFFELTPEEKEKALQTLSGPERRQIETTLKSFENLSAEQRATCIRSFAKFASLSLAERAQFLKNAERWKAMSPAERQAWRDLVRNIPPPLPPDLPPLPRSVFPPRSGRAVATNRN